MKPRDPYLSDRFANRGGAGPTEETGERWTKLPSTYAPGALRWSGHLRRYIDIRYESDRCVFCGAEIDPDTAYHGTICRRCS